MNAARWQSFLPWLVGRELAAHPDVDPRSRVQRFTAVALFADISGFTAISEALGALGRSGTEELITLLNRYFGPMIELIHSHGGCIAMEASSPFENRPNTWLFHA